MAILFGVPKWVDTEKPAGRTRQLPPLLKSVQTYWFDLLSLQRFFAVPPTVLLVLFCCAMHFVLDPYDMEAAAKGVFRHSFLEL